MTYTDKDDELALALHSPEKVWFEMHREKDACDVLVKMDDGVIYTATFVTIAYFLRQMEFNMQMTRQMAETTPVRYAAIDTPHIILESLDADTIEDTIDNLLALDVFESHFTRLTENEAERAMRTQPRGKKRATQEHAAVVIAEVLVVRN